MALEQPPEAYDLVRDLQLRRVGAPIDGPERQLSDFISRHGASRLRRRGRAPYRRMQSLRLRAVVGSELFAERLEAGPATTTPTAAILGVGAGVAALVALHPRDLFPC